MKNMEKESTGMDSKRTSLSLSSCIEGFVRKYMESSSISEQPIVLKNFVNQIVELNYESHLSVSMIITSLQESLTSADDSTRRKSASLLTSILSRNGIDSSKFPNFLTSHSIHMLSLYFSRRLSDVECLLPTLQGIHALIVNYKEVFSPVHFDIPVLLQALFSNIYLPAYAQNVRQEVLDLVLDILHTDCFVISLSGESSVETIDQLLNAIEGEKDPRCLYRSLVLITLAYQAFSSSVTTDLAEKAFQFAGAYFPISFQPKKDDPFGITSGMLVTALERVFFCHQDVVLFSVPYFLEQLQSDLSLQDTAEAITKKHIYSCLAQGIRSWSYNIFLGYSKLSNQSMLLILRDLWYEEVHNLWENLTSEDVNGAALLDTLYCFFHELSDSMLSAISIDDHIAHRDSSRMDVDGVEMSFDNPETKRFRSSSLTLILSKLSTSNFTLISDEKKNWEITRVSPQAQWELVVFPVIQKVFQDLQDLIDHNQVFELFRILSFIQYSFQWKSSVSLHHENLNACWIAGLLPIMQKSIRFQMHHFYSFLSQEYFPAGFSHSRIDSNQNILCVQDCFSDLIGSHRHQHGCGSQHEGSSSSSCCNSSKESCCQSNGNSHSHGINEMRSYIFQFVSDVIASYSSNRTTFVDVDDDGWKGLIDSLLLPWHCCLSPANVDYESWVTDSLIRCGSKMDLGSSQGCISVTSYRVLEDWMVKYLHIIELLLEQSSTISLFNESQLEFLGSFLLHFSLFGDSFLLFSEWEASSSSSQILQSPIVMDQQKSSSIIQLSSRKALLALAKSSSMWELRLWRILTHVSHQSSRSSVEVHRELLLDMQELLCDHRINNHELFDIIYPVLKNYLMDFKHHPALSELVLLILQQWIKSSIEVEELVLEAWSCSHQNPGVEYHRSNDDNKSVLIDSIDNEHHHGSCWIQEWIVSLASCNDDDVDLLSSSAANHVAQLFYALIKVFSLQSESCLRYFEVICELLINDTTDTIKIGKTSSVIVVEVLISCLLTLPSQSRLFSDSSNKNSMIVFLTSFMEQSKLDHSFEWKSLSKLLFLVTFKTPSSNQEYFKWINAKFVEWSDHLAHQTKLVTLSLYLWVSLALWMRKDMKYSESPTTTLQELTLDFLFEHLVHFPIQETSQYLNAFVIDGLQGDFGQSKEYNIFWKQRLWMRFVDRLSTSFITGNTDDILASSSSSSSTTTTIAASTSTATVTSSLDVLFCGVLSIVPIQVITSSSKLPLNLIVSILLRLLKSDSLKLSSKDIQYCETAQQSLLAVQSLLTHTDPKVFAPFLNSLVPILLQNAESFPLAHGRFSSLSSISILLHNLPFFELYPFKRIVLKSLSKCLNDRKRTIRMMSAKIRNQWITMKSG